MHIVLVGMGSFISWSSVIAKQGRINMNMFRLPFEITQARLFACALVGTLLGPAACAGDMASSNDESIGVQSQAIKVPAVYIDNNDGRTMTDFRITTDYTLYNRHYSDWEDIPSWLWGQQIDLESNAVRGSCQGSECGGDMLYWKGYDTESGNGRTATNMEIHKMDGQQYNDMRITVDFKINGERHYDSHYVGSWGASWNVYLQMSAYGGTWNGSYWVGDFIEPSPGR